MDAEYIVVLSGSLKGRHVPLTDTLTIGRGPENGVPLNDLQVSRRHAVVERRPEGVVLRDLGSGNGTYVGGRRILEVRLTPGDVFSVGPAELRYEKVPTVARSRNQTVMAVRFEGGEGGAVQAEPAAAVYQTFFESSTRARTHEELADVQRRLAAVYAANELIASERNLTRLFERVMEQIFALVPAHNGVILLRHADTGALATEYVRTSQPGGEVVISSTIMQRASERGEAVLTYDAAGDARFGGGSIIAQNISSAMCAPLVHQDANLGVVYVDTRGTTHAFTQKDLELLVAVAGPAAIAIRNAQYVQQLEQAYEDTLLAMANAIEMRDHYTVGHTWRVTNFALAMARELGWPEERLRLCEMGGVLHDIGKIAIPDAILGKPGKLTDDEFQMMRVHPERGARMMRDIQFLEPLIPYCLYHHERYDGKGYPFGLAGEAIPIEGRLLAVADTFDAMTSNRPYRKGLDPEVALAEIEKGGGTQFDPVCVGALVTAYRSGKIDAVIQGYLAHDQKSIACPFCSTFIAVPEAASVEDVFACNVCHRHVRLCEQNNAYYGELLPETEKG